MNLMAPIALFGWIPLILLLFALLNQRQVVAASCVFGWMLLPPAGYALPGLPDYNKVSAVVLAILLGALAFDANRLLQYRPHWLDVPMLVWCLCPLASSLSNDLGVYDGMSGILNQMFRWGLPYALGRVYLRNADDLYELAVWVVIGGLIYVPFCIFETRMSPVLCRWVYGFGGARVAYEGLGKWGSRPRVFMGDGLSLGMFMTAASLLGIWLWRAGVLRRLGGIAFGPLLAVLIGTAVLCKNLGALILLLLGVAVCVGLRRYRTALPLYVLVAFIPFYMVVRSAGTWSGDIAVALAGLIHEDRAGSLQFRLDNEDILTAHALERPVFGWGGWGRNRPVAEEAGRTVTDGLWVMTLGMNGIVGLASLTVAILLPPLAFMRRCPAAFRREPACAAALGLATLVALHMMDCLMNAMLNPVFIVAAGGLTSVAITPVRAWLIDAPAPLFREASLEYEWQEPPRHPGSGVILET